MKPLPVTDADSIANRLEIGDKIKVVRRDQTEVTFTIVEMSDEGISGGNFSVPYTDVQQIEVKRTSVAKTAGLVAIGIVGVAYAVGDAVAGGFSN